MLLEFNEKVVNFYSTLTGDIGIFYVQTYCYAC